MRIHQMHLYNFKKKLYSQSTLQKITEINLDLILEYFKIS